MATTVEELRVKVTADTAQAERGLDAVDDKAGKSGKGFGAAKAAAVGFGVGGAAAIAGKLIGAASDLNETVSKTGVVFGGQTDQVTGYAQKMADDFGLPKTAVLDAASAFGLLGQAAGLNGKPLADMSTGLTDLAADAMSFYNVPLEQALGDFTSALSGESEPVKKYGVLMNEAAVQAEAMALGLAKPVRNTQALRDAQLAAKVAQAAYTKAVKDHGAGSLEAQKAENALAKANDKVGAASKGTVGPLTEAMKVQARASLLSKGMSKAQGDLARTSDSVSNRTKMLQGRVQNLAADMGAKLLPAAGAVLGGLLGLIDALPKVVGFLKDNATTIGIVAGIITAILLPALISWGVQSTIAAAKSVAAWVTTQASAIASGWAQFGAALKVVAGWVLMGVQSMLQAARMAAAWLIAMGPVGWVIAAVIALAVLIYKNWDSIKAATIKAWGAIVGWLKTAWGWIKSTFSSALAFVKGLVSAYFNGYKAVIMAVWNAIKSVTSSALSGVKSVISSAWSWVKSTTSNAWNGIKSAVSNSVGGLLGVVKGIPGRIKGALGNLAHLLWDSGQRIMQGLADGIRAGLGRVTNAVKNVLQQARNLLPFSPAKTGPFSGRGWTLYSGRSISAALAKGMGQNVSQVRKAALGMARAAVPDLGAVRAPGVTLGAVGASRGSQGRGVALRPSEMATGVRRADGPGIVQHIYYPVAEKTSVATNRGLQRIATLPVGG